MANEKRLIDANAEISKMRDALAKNKRNMRHLVYWVFDAVISVLEKAPTVDAVEVVQGRWVKKSQCVFDCSECGITTARAIPIKGLNESALWNYCPNCGAKMDGDGNG